MTSFPAIDNSDGGPFSSDALKKIEIISDKFGTINVYPSSTAHSGQTPFYSLSLTESLFSPIVSGNLIVKDIGNFVDNLNLEGFETIKIVFEKIKDSPDNLFTGIITDVTLMSNDAVLAARMDSLERYRFFNLSFINKDVFIANYKKPQNAPSNIFGAKDFVGWISNS